MEVGDFDWESVASVGVKSSRRCLSLGAAKIIILDDADRHRDGRSFTFSAFLPGDALEHILVMLLRVDKMAPRSARVARAWAQGMANALTSFAGTGHHWWSQPFQPIQPVDEGIRFSPAGQFCM
jgi:hypothetical protein